MKAYLVTISYGWETQPLKVFAKEKDAKELVKKQTKIDDFYNYEITEMEVE